MPMVDAMEWVLAKPVWFALPALFVIVMLRSHATYWLGRATSRGATELARVTAGDEAAEATAATPGGAAGGAQDGTREGNRLVRAWRSGVVRVRRWSRTAPARRSQAIVHRWGPVAVTVAYFTVGLQSAILASAGLLRMPYGRFTLASIPGGIGWAFLWFGIGMGAWWAAAAVAAQSRWTAVGVGLLALVVVVVALWRRRAHGAATQDAAPDAPVQPATLD